MRVLFTSTAGWGHLHPMVPLARALADGGDELLWATSAEGCARLEQERIPAVACGLDASDSAVVFAAQFPEFDALPPPARADFMFPRLFGSVRAAPMLEGLVPIADGWRPDLVVCDAADFAGHIAAARLGVPSVTHAFGSLVPAERVAAAGERVAGLWRSQGLEPRPYGGSYHHLYLDIYPPSVQVADRDHVAASQHLRPGSFATEGDERVPEWLSAASATPLVYVTLGTVFSSEVVLAGVVESMRELDVRVVVTVGPTGDPEALGPQPSNVHVARYLPQDQLLPHCAAVVSHAGSGTFLAALAAGLPQLCLPQAADQFINAAACVRSGSGLALQPDAVSIEAVRAAIEQLLSDARYRDAARRLSLEIAAMPSPAVVAERLHAHAAPRQ